MYVSPEGNLMLLAFIRSEAFNFYQKLIIIIISTINFPQFVFLR